MFGKKKSDKKVSLTVLIPESDKAWLDEQAVRDETTASDVLRQILKANRPTRKQKAGAESQS